jgi:cytosine deaminase
VIIRAGQLGTIAKGGPARLILFNARTLNELICRPQSDRLVIELPIPGNHQLGAI